MLQRVVWRLTDLITLILWYPSYDLFMLFVLTYEHLFSFLYIYFAFYISPAYFPVQKSQIF
jgi:hypothetical protein